MYQFITKENNILVIDLNGRGLLFQYVTGPDPKRDIFEVTQSWAGIHSLLSKLRNSQTYAAWDKSMAVWMQDQELCLMFRALSTKLEKKGEFSPEETAKLLDFLGRAPNLN